MSEIRRFLKCGAPLAEKTDNLGSVSKRFTTSGTFTTSNSAYGQSLDFLAANRITALATYTGNMTTIFIRFYSSVEIVGASNPTFSNMLGDPGAAGTFLGFGNASGGAVGETVSISYGGISSMVDTISIGWHDLVAVHDGTKYQFYLDGTARTTLGSSTQMSNFKPAFGARTGYSDGFLGKINAVAIFPYAWSAKDIKNLYDNNLFDYTKNIISQIQLDTANTGASLIRDVGFRNTGCNGTVVGAPTISNNMSGGKALKFGGTNDYVNFGTTINSYLATDKKFSVSFWFKSEVSATDQALFSNADFASPFKGFDIVMVAAGTLRIDLVQEVSPTQFARRVTTATYNNNAWRHLVVTYDGLFAATGIKLYIDGVEQTLTTQQNGIVGAATSVTNLQVGARDALNIPLNGQLSNIMVFDKELTYLEAKDLYANTKAGLI